MYKSFIFALLVFFTACSSENEEAIQEVDTSIIAKKSELIYNKIEKKSDIYSIGFDIRNEPQENILQYLPLLKYLERTTKLHFKIHITPKNNTSENELCSNNAQFSIIGALSFLKAYAECDAQVLVRALNNKNQATYKSIFIARPDSKINSINDLQGARFSFGNINSTQGYLIPRQVLNEYNINLTDFKEYKFTNSHQECAESVVSGESDVCAIQDMLAKELSNSGLVKIIYTSPPYSASLIAVNKDVPKEVKEKVKQALLNFDPIDKDKKNLYHWEKTEMPLGFTDGNFSDYSKLYKIANQLNILKTP